MLLECSNKGCCRSGEHKLDVKTNEVICEYCGRPIPTITEAMKRALKAARQVVATVKKAFMFGCKHCQANREVILDESTNTVRCKICGNEVNVHPVMKQTLIEMAKTKED
jgi:ribosomal protein S27E